MQPLLVNLPTFLTTERADTFPRWPHPYHRPTENSHLLCTAAEAEGHSCFRGRYPPDIVTVAAGRLSGRAIWDICAIWGLLFNDWWICWEHPCSGTVYTTGIGQCRRWTEEL